MTAGLWPWATLVALGMFHGINPAMGWLFAVALGMQQRERGAVVRALIPIAAGHGLSILAVLTAFLVLQTWIDSEWVRIIAAVLLFGMAVYRLFRRHQSRGGMQVGFKDLVVWSFIMATAHGAGLMLLPVLLHMPATASHAHAMHTAPAADMGDPLVSGILATLVHTAAMLLTAGVIAVAVYRWFGVAFLRRGWINLDLLWSFALIAAGISLLLPSWL